MNGLLYKALQKTNTLSAAELGVLDGVTKGTSAANKAVVLGADGKINTIDVTSLKVGGTAVSASAAELNILDGVTASAAELNKLDNSGAVVASGTKAAHIANIATDANGTAIAAAVNGILAVLEAFGMTATA